MALIPVTEYSPDMPALNNPGSQNIFNCIPRTTQSYGPFPALSEYGGPLNAICQGAYSCIDSSGNPNVFAGDINNLYNYTAASTTPNIVSNGVNPYTTAADERWNFSLFGQRVVATNFHDKIQSYVLGVSVDFADLAAAAPKARYIGVIKGFLVAGNTTDGTYGNQPQRVWWAAQNDPTNWPTPGTALAAQFQSSFNDLYGDAGWVTGIVGNLGTADGAIFMEHAIWRVNYIGPPVVFDFQPAEGIRGTQAPGSIAQLGGIVYYWGEDGFYSFDGTNSVPIGFDKVDKTTLADLDFTQISRMTGAIDPINRLYLCAYPGQGNINGVPNKILAYHWPTQRWSLITDNVEIIFRAMTFSNNVLDSVGAVSLDTAAYNTFPMDSRVWTGGSITMGGFDNNHSLAYFNGTPYAATIETSEGEPFEGKLTFVQNSRPLVDGGFPLVRFGYRNRLIDPVVYTGFEAINATGTTPQNVNGRYLRAQIFIPANSSWSHVQGIEVDGIPNGVM